MLLDEVLLLFDQAISARESAAKAKLTEILAERARGGEDRQALLDEILAIGIDPAISDEMVGRLLREGVGLDRLRAAWAARRERLPRDHGHLERWACWPPPTETTGPQMPLTEPVAVAGRDATFPVRHGEQVLGALTVTKARGEPIRPAEHRLLPIRLAPVCGDSPTGWPPSTAA